MTIDWWTLGLQTVNVLILVWLLARFFWRPLAAMIETRRKAAADILADAEARRAEAAASLADIEKTRAGFAIEREAVLAEAHATAEKLRAELEAKAHAEAAALRDAARAEIMKEEKESRQDWAERAARLAVDIAGRLVGRLRAAPLHESFLAGLAEEIGRLPDPARRSLATGDAAFEAVSAEPLDADEQDRCRQRITEALGGPAQLTFRTDPELLAGIELHGPHLVVANSWRADLDRIRKELANESRS